MKNKFFQNIIILVLCLFLILFISHTWAPNQYHFKDTFSYQDSHLLVFLANFDGVHYLRIAKDGYLSADGIQAFFPAYPMLISIITSFTSNYLISGILISLVFFIASLIFLYKLLRLDYSHQTSQEALLFTCFFSTSFYFLAVYTESLFLFLTLAFFYYLRRGKYKLSAFLGILASATRLTGIFLIPAFIYELWTENKEPKLNFANTLKKYWITLIPAIGLLSYMLYLHFNFNDALLFVNVQSGFGAGRETGKLILFYQVFWRYLKMIFTVDRTNPIFYTFMQEFFYTLLFIGLLIYGYLKKVRPSYLLYACLSLILPTLTGTLSSMPRYLLVLFPAFISMSLLDHKIFKYSLFIINLILLFINFALFSQGHWVS